jgi:hypothetical protein
MKYLLPLAGMLYCLSSLAQNNTATKKSRQILIGFNVSTLYNYRSLTNSGGDAFADVIIKDRNAREKGRIGYVAGVSLSRNISKHFSIEAGIVYADRGYETKSYNLVYSSPDPAAPTQAKYVYKYRYIDVPVKLRLDAGDKKVRFTSSAGLAINFSADISNKGIYTYADGRTEKRNMSSQFHYNPINISPVLSAGALYELNKKTFLRIEPIVQFNLLKTIDMPVTENLWSAGVNMGLYYRFR